jgi:hypothetical protein
MGHHFFVLSGKGKVDEKLFKERMSAMAKKL